MKQKNKSLSVCRKRGLGNVIILLSVLKKIYSFGVNIELVTNSEWIEFLVLTNPWLRVTDKIRKSTIDLDILTQYNVPLQYKAYEFSKHLNVCGPFEKPKLILPPQETRFNKKIDIAFCPEANHPARVWPLTYAQSLLNNLSKRITILGKDRGKLMYAENDLRGKLSVIEFAYAISESNIVVTMDSASLHLALALGIPTIAIFSGINPIYRIPYWSKCIAVQAEMSCCPCNKNEICNGRYDCLSLITPEIVLSAFKIVQHTNRRKIIRE